MEKKLPKVFANAIKKPINNNCNFFYSNSDRSKDSERSSLIGQNIEQKIHSIFKSVNFVYKMDVIIELESGKVKKRIIGRNRDSLITADNEFIKIANIIDIDYAK